VKTIVVSGDLMWNHYLVRTESTPKAHHEATVSTVVEHYYGGAWYTAELVRKACSRPPEVGFRVLEAPREDNVRPGAEFIIHDAYQVCTQSVYQADGRKRKTWRIKDFLGCNLPRTANRPLAVEEDVPDPDLLVIDDVNLGFNEDVRLWPSALAPYAGPIEEQVAAPPEKTHVVYKTSAFPTSKLWKRLLRYFADRLTVIMPVDALRTKCAAISKALSWDQTIEDVVREFEHGACTGELAKCRRVIVHFGPAGAACLSRVPLYGVKLEPPRASLNGPTYDREVCGWSGSSIIPMRWKGPGTRNTRA